MLGEATTAQSVKQRARSRPEEDGREPRRRPRSSRSPAPTPTAASTQLQSFVERWKTEGVDTIFLSGLQVSAQQFVPQPREGDAGRAAHRRQQHRRAQYGQNLQKAGTRPEPVRGDHRDRGLEREATTTRARTGRRAPRSTRRRSTRPRRTRRRVIPGPRGHTLDISGSITDACTELTMFHDIGEQRRASTSTTPTGSNAVNNYGKIRDHGVEVRIAAHRQVRRRRHVRARDVRPDDPARGRLALPHARSRTCPADSSVRSGPGIGLARDACTVLEP